MKFIDKLNNKKTVIVLIILMMIGISLIFTQYFGLFPLDDDYALDMLNYYSKTKFFNNLESMNQSSRISYFMIHLGDYIFMFGFYQLLGVFLYRLINIKSRLRYLTIIPYLAFLFDFLENILMDIHLAIFPNQIDFLGYIAGISTFLKFTTLYLSLILIVLVIIYRFVMNRYKSIRL